MTPETSQSAPRQAREPRGSIGLYSFSVCDENMKRLCGAKHIEITNHLPARVKRYALSTLNPKSSETCEADRVGRDRERERERDRERERESHSTFRNDTRGIAFGQRSAP